jgi:hypothetical protein
MTATLTKKKPTLRNPEKWIGKKIFRFANWLDYQFGDDYAVCEWTGKLIRTEDNAAPSCDDWLKFIECGIYDPCYYYSEEGIAQMEAYYDKHQPAKKYTYIGF